MTRLNCFIHLTPHILHMTLQLEIVQCLQEASATLFVELHAKFPFKTEAMEMVHNAISTNDSLYIKHNRIAKAIV